MEKEIVKIGIGEIAIVQKNVLLRTIGLGSCVGVVIFDELKGIAGMAHVMLPNSSTAKFQTESKGKYADLAIKQLINDLIRNGARIRSLKAKYAGGSQMFSFNTKNDMMRIGERNIEAVHQQLVSHNIPVLSSDTGGNKGRTIEFDPLTSKLGIKCTNKEIFFI